MLVLFASIFTALLLFYVGYLLRSAFYWAKLPELETTVRQAFPKVTVIVPARNEAQNIVACIQAILSQNYPTDRFELILVNDHSEDETVALAQKAAGNAPNFKLLHLSQSNGAAYKKAAVAQAIAAAAGDIILTTDADCEMGPNWLSAMVDGFQDDTGMVSGPVTLEGDSVFMQFQTLEFIGLVAVGAAGIAAKQPTMCNGANLAYRKAAFEAVAGFAGIDHIASGDDELLMHKIAATGRYHIAFVRNRDAVVRTNAQPTWQDLKRQRIRWVSKSTAYKRRSITMTLVLAYLAMLGFPFLWVAGCWEPWLWVWLLVNLLLKILAEAIVIYPAAVFFGKLRLMKWLPLEQIAHIAYVLWVGIAGNRKSYEWKGRKVQ